MKLLLESAKGNLVSTTPIWLMRQAGRYLPEYQEVREKVSFLEACQNPEIAATISLQPWKRFGFDGVIVFSDIMIPAQAMGVEMTFNPGPIIKKPLRFMKDLVKLEMFDPQDKTSFVLDALKILKNEISQETTLIGFCGAPFTVASYLIEGKHSDDFSVVKKMIHDEPLFLHLLLDKLTFVMTRYLKAQIESGADIVQLFDTHVSWLTEEEYLQFAFPYEKRIVDEIKKSVPIILFTKETKNFLNGIRQMEAPIVSVDANTSLLDARASLGNSIVLQGNLNPEILRSGTKEDIEKETKNILNQMSEQKHIFNLGHGVLPNTPVENVSYLVDVVRNYATRCRSH